MSLPVIIDANSPTPADHVKLYISCADQYRYGDKVVLIDLSHDFQVMGHLDDVLAQSLGGLVKARDVKLSISGESQPISAADRISDVIDRITPVDGLHHLTMVVEEWTPRVYSSNPFEMRNEWEMYRPIYKTW
jgi:hypothetical protein